MKRSKFEKDIEKAVSSLIAARVCVETYKHINQFPIILSKSIILLEEQISKIRETHIIYLLNNEVKGKDVATLYNLTSAKISQIKANYNYKKKIAENNKQKVIETYNEVFNKLANQTPDKHPIEDILFPLLKEKK